MASTTRIRRCGPGGRRSPAWWKGEFHQKLIAGGAAHVLGVPHILIEGHRAVATCYSRVFRHGEGGFELWRVAVNRWELVRTPEGWRASYRTNRLLDGSEAARALLGRAGEAWTTRRPGRPVAPPERPERCPNDQAGRWRSKNELMAPRVGLGYSRSMP